MTFFQFFQSLQDRWQQLSDRLQQIDQTPMVKQYPQVRGPERMTAITSWRDTTLAEIQRFRSTDLPAIQKTARENVALALANVRAGRPPQQGPSPAKQITDPTPWLDGGPERVAQIRATADTLDSMGELKLQLQISNSISLNQLQTTDALIARANAYTAATADPQTFDFSAWAIDRLSLPVILRARAVNDPRAGMTADQLERLEDELVSASGFRSGSTTQMQGTLDSIEAAIGDLGRGGMENIEPLERMMSSLGRIFAQRQQLQEAV